MLNPLHWQAGTFAALILILLAARLFVRWPQSSSPRVVKEILVVVPAVFLYFLVRGLVAGDDQVAIRHAQQIIDLEQRLGIFIEPSMQRAVLQSQWLIDLVNWIYVWAHWPVITAVAIWLVLFHANKFPVYRNAMLISGVVGMIIFALFPAAPPRLMPEYGFVDTITLRSNSYRVLQPPALTDIFASMPSLHFGWNLPRVQVN